MISTNPNNYKNPCSETRVKRIRVNQEVGVYDEIKSKLVLLLAVDNLRRL